MDFDTSYFKNSKELILNKRSYLQNLSNSYGDFKICNNYISGDIKEWTKHRSILECWENEKLIKFLDLATHRSQLKNEIILDIDHLIDKNKLIEIYNNLTYFNLKFCIFFTGSNGYHIHINIPENYMNPERFRKNFIFSFEKEYADKLKYSDNVMIALEFSKHWKSGKIKTPIMSNPDGWWFI